MLELIGITILTVGLMAKIPEEWPSETRRACRIVIIFTAAVVFVLGLAKLSAA